MNDPWTRKSFSVKQCYILIHVVCKDVFDWYCPHFTVSLETESPQTCVCAPFVYETAPNKPVLNVSIWQQKPTFYSVSRNVVIVDKVQTFQVVLWNNLPITVKRDELHWPQFDSGRDAILYCACATEIHRFWKGSDLCYTFSDLRTRVFSFRL